MVQSPLALASVIPTHTVECTVLTPSGTLVARGRLTPRRVEYLEEAYALAVSEIDPPGVLEAMVYADRPHVVLRTEQCAEVHVRIDHITGPPRQREFFCHLV